MFLNSCVSHTLNLLATTDLNLSKFTMTELPIKNALRKVLSKFQALWNKQGRSVQDAEKIKAVFGNSSSS